MEPHLASRVEETQFCLLAITPPSFQGANSSLSANKAILILLIIRSTLLLVKQRQYSLTAPLTLFQGVSQMQLLSLMYTGKIVMAHS